MSLTDLVPQLHSLSRVEKLQAIELLAQDLARSEDAPPSGPTEKNDLKQQAWQAFLRDLPKLYAERPGQWVAYRGEQIITFGTRKHLLYQECASQGLEDEEFVIF